jgi:hypothetical protein
MNDSHWTIGGLPWERLDVLKADVDLLRIVKAASLVEYNASSYADYLCRVFHDDPQFQKDARQWAVEEVQHGAALAAWAERIDTSWNFTAAMEKFRAGYTPEHFLDDSLKSVRGSRSGELVARCMVEVGTSSYYSAIADMTEEPVLKQIARHIAADEFRHYKLFYDTLNRYLPQEHLGRMGRLRVALSRIAESEDDELSYAYFAANAGPDEVYDRKKYNDAYTSRAYKYFRPKHADRAVGMIFKACGLKPHSIPHKIASKVAWHKIEKMAA